MEGSAARLLTLILINIISFVSDPNTTAASISVLLQPDISPPTSPAAD